ncbi:pantoate--beta-alanine ligase [Candidatus Acetothermia bacterium]|jgi:pantoate--beta-alanine ligase|nr:pantoate--beta-alanine ligase [Candidatus Acetothermia bacterium]MCI2431763.1 pantoate--beta-alanine ligase [Candidatus Acetothermia bacterium]MCI2436753.1 pantoate--beta-alanine ligase [Candidatus Acetothermia bacterium]
MLLTRTIAETRAVIADARTQGKRIGFVPTMGYLHEGHLKLIDIAKGHSDFVVVSIFVNPTQFSPTEDFAKYPRDFERDRRLCESRGTDLIFAPEVSEIYPERSLITLQIEKLADRLCGMRRPGHFNGVLLVVSKLFNIVQPNVAVFGQKDAQQLTIIKRFVQDLNFPVRIIAAPTVRESDGLAMSSRNIYLSPEQRAQSTVLYQALQRAKTLIEAGQRDAQKIVLEMQQLIATASEAKIDYIEIVSVSDLQPVKRLDGERQVLIALAVYFGRARLIDNIVLKIS